jgi:hypothetical protein
LLAVVTSVSACVADHTCGLHLCVSLVLPLLGKVKAFDGSSEAVQHRLMKWAVKLLAEGACVSDARRVAEVANERLALAEMRRRLALP